MTVADLMLALSKLPLDAPVIFEHPSNDDWWTIGSAKYCRDVTSAILEIEDPFDASR